MGRGRLEAGAGRKAEWIMKRTGIVTDSHSGIEKAEADRLGIYVLPMPFYIDGSCYYEGVTIGREEFFQKLEAGAQVQTSQPSPAEVMGVWDQALSEYEEILYMPISSGLSGSYGTARVLAEEEPYQGRVYPVDHGQVATPLHQMILDALEMIKKGYSAVKIREILEKARDRMMIFICVETLEYLKRGGRITPAAAALGTVLQIKPVLKLEVGKLDSYKKCHGFLKARRAAIEAMKQLIETKFQAAYQAGALRLFAASSADEEETEGWIAEIKRIFPGMEVMCDNLSLGVSCHTGPGALGIGCSVCPEFEDAEE